MKNFTHSTTLSPVVLIFILLLLEEKASAQQTLSLRKHDAVITIDGRVDEPIWEEIDVLPLTQKVPNSGADPSQKTELRITYDSEFLYLSGRMYDDDSDKIVANSKKRDDFTENTEWCGFLIDSYNDRENALAFYVTPHGSRLDMAISNDAQGANPFNVSWNTYWDGAATRDEKGWYAEIKVPFKNLPFEVAGDQVVMGITAWRYYARNDETDIFPSRDLTTGSSFRASLTQQFIFKGINRANPVYVTPYVLGGVSLLNAHSGNSTDYSSQQAYKKEAGLDVKLGLSSNATMDITLNTDFAQVEVDDQQVNLTRFNVFFPEKRLFFQERASLFDFNFGLFDKVFYTRRIGIADGRPTRIYGGLRTFGRFGNLESGLISMQTAPQGGAESENFSVFRVRQRAFNENSTIGAIVTNRTDFKGAYNTVYGLDATVRYFKQNYLAVRWAQSFGSELGNDALSLNPTKYYIELSRRSLQGFTYNVNYGSAGRAYKPAVGFEQRDDFSKLNYRLAYYVFPRKKASIIQYGPYFSGDFIWGNSTGILESRNLNLGFDAFSKSGWYYNVEYRPYREVLPQALGLPGGVDIESGTYHFNSVLGIVQSPSSYKLSFMLSVGTGGFYDGKKTSLWFMPFFNWTEDLSIEGSYQYNYLTFPETQETVGVQLTQLKVLYTLNTKIAVSGFVQHNNLQKRFQNGFRIRYNPKEGNDFYFVFNGDLNHDRDRAEPSLPLSLESTFLVKYSHTFHL